MERVNSTLFRDLPSDSEFQYEVTVRLPSGAIVYAEAHASQTGYEFHWCIALRYSLVMDEGVLTHGGRITHPAYGLAQQRVLPGSVIVVLGTSDSRPPASGDTGSCRTGAGPAGPHAFGADPGHGCVQ